MIKYAPVFTLECAPSWVPFEVVMNKHGDLTDDFGNCAAYDTAAEAHRIITEVISVEGQAKHLGSNLFLELVDWEILKIREGE
ncbi:hypothetical protein QPX10_10525 [Corynebacterium pseudodiphtheriticum]|uniref:hypothetical protein n=1 Tax=Corynebacterium TaxID=1716 RepID=UPI0025406439|nr:MULTISPECIES: hypothetical protein [Corynebacterium]MDK4244100.1 hypothetical protein [Corynebacterium pseudodiphtheriticum]MDK4258476.1 hypothetical protein [Corynebacterium propinquum]